MFSSSEKVYVGILVSEEERQLVWGVFCNHLAMAALISESSCEQVHLRCTPQLEQLEHHSVGSGWLHDRKLGNSLLTPGWCIVLTLIDLGINHLNRAHASSLRVLVTTPLCLFMYNTMAVLLDSIKIVCRGCPAPDVGGSGRLL